MSKILPRPPGSSFSGKWSFSWGYDNFFVPVSIIADHDETLCRPRVNQSEIFPTPVPFIVYGDLEKGPFYLASPEGLPLDFVGNDFGNPKDYLCNAPTYAEFKPTLWQQFSFGSFYYYICNAPGRLTSPTDDNDYGLLNIDASGQAHDVFGPTSQVQGLSWIQSNGGAKLDLSYVDLSGAKLSGVDLTGANLTQADLSGAILTGATFTGATLTNADFTAATLTGAKFINCDLTQAKFSPGAVFGTKDAPGSFAGSTLPYGLIGLNWSYLDLTGTTIKDLPVNLTGLQAIGTTVQTFPAKVQLANASFQDADMSGTKFTNANLTGAIFTGANLSTVAFDADTQLAGASFDYAFLNSTAINAANLSGIDFSYATLKGAGFNANAVTLDNTNFANAYLENVAFPAGINLRGSTFTGACLINCNFNGADFSTSETQSTNLVNAFIQGANFSTTKLGGCNLTGAMVSFDACTNPPNNLCFQSQYCDGTGTLSGLWPMNFSPTTGLDGSTLQNDTICPNGNRYDANKHNGLTLTQMLTAAAVPPTQWSPVGCRPSA